MTAIAQTRPTVPRGTAGRRLARRSARYLFVAPALFYLLLLMFYPLAYTFNLSVFDVNAGNFLRGGAAFVGLQNYLDFISSPDFLSSLAITLIFTVGSLVFQHVIGFCFALFFNTGFPLSGLLRAIMMVVWVLPAVVSASLWRWMYAGSYGVINAFLGLFGIHTTQAWLTDPSTALPAVIISNIWIGIPFHMMLVFAGLQTIPTTLYEAAAIDGASAWRRFWSITAPLMRPVILTALLLGFVHTFKVFDIIYVMTSGGPANATNVLSIAVYKLSFEYFRLGDGAAAANVLLVIPLLLSIVYLFFRRREETSL
ncbi:sugar ABC transporter permease [Pseudolysinimonas kribbensis]|uniref:ABC transporter permease n=1 Tax=Pseudolysinimonas kribbensis TaxID=433641 RepID=A0ABQ6K8X8_9MICO|nr:sugar ABC transporter permease [Pseudolysinimonas kribbensis]GMA96050.1 ABC transporter permease [Pseudolysinimonas kribbensis]